REPPHLVRREQPALDGPQVFEVLDGRLRQDAAHSHGLHRRGSDSSGYPPPYSTRRLAVEKWAKAPSGRRCASAPCSLITDRPVCKRCALPSWGPPCAHGSNWAGDGASP